MRVPGPGTSNMARAGSLSLFTMYLSVAAFLCHNAGILPSATLGTA